MSVVTDACRLALLGQSCGDAFGDPFEYHKDAARLAGLSMADGRYLDGQADCNNPVNRCRLPGLYTDDTQQSLVLVHARLVGVEVETAPNTSEAFRLMARTPIGGHGAFGVHRGTGANFRKAVTSGTPDTAGLGAAMRVGPVATLFDDPQEMIDWVYAVSMTTTTNPVGLACAVRFAAFVWATAYGRASDLRSVRWPGLPPEVWEATTRAIGIMKTRQNEEELLEFARSTGWADKPMQCAANGFALTGVAWVISHGLGADCFQNALLNVCGSGGDTDTVAAMAGCLAALKHGQNDIPYWMIAGLHGIDHLQHPESWQPVESEQPLTQADKDYRAKLADPKPPQQGSADWFEALDPVPEPLEPVLFYGNRNENGEFSNFYLAPFGLDGERWTAVEFYYMAQKCPKDKGYQRAIRNAGTPGQAKRLGREVKLRPNWDNIKYGIMFRAVRAKFEQNPELREKLLATGDRPIHENCKDPWWGGGPNFKGGRDWLGRILTRVRKERGVADDFETLVEAAKPQAQRVLRAMRTRQPLLEAVRQYFQPHTREDAIVSLLCTMASEDLEVIRKMPADDLITLHHNLGRAIRNTFNMRQNDPLVRDCLPHNDSDDSDINADDASMSIIVGLWERLQG